MTSQKLLEVASTVWWLVLFLSFFQLFVKTIFSASYLFILIFIVIGELFGFSEFWYAISTKRCSKNKSMERVNDQKNFQSLIKSAKVSMAKDQLKIFLSAVTKW